MIDQEDRSTSQVGSFFLGFFFAMVVCLGAGAALYVVQSDRQSGNDLFSQQALERAKAEALRAEESATQQRQLAEQALREAREAMQNPNN